MGPLRCVICGMIHFQPTKMVGGPYRLARFGSCGLEFTANTSPRVGAYAISYRDGGGVLANPTPYVSSPVRLLPAARALRARATRSPLSGAVFWQCPRTLRTV
jgi:hypothetical protein